MIEIVSSPLNDLGRGLRLAPPGHGRRERLRGRAQADHDQEGGEGGRVPGLHADQAQHDRRVQDGARRCCGPRGAQGEPPPGPRRGQEDARKSVRQKTRKARLPCALAIPPAPPLSSAHACCSSERRAALDTLACVTTKVAKVAPKTNSMDDAIVLPHSVPRCVPQLRVEARPLTIYQAALLLQLGAPLVRARPMA